MKCQMEGFAGGYVFDISTWKTAHGKDLERGGFRKSWKEIKELICAVNSVQPIKIKHIFEKSLHRCSLLLF